MVVAWDEALNPQITNGPTNPRKVFFIFKVVIAVQFFAVPAGSQQWKPNSTGVSSSFAA
jgi:hypothetical protein